MSSILGGSDRISVGNGDLYLIHSPAGTTALLRDQTVQTDSPDLAEAYTILPPPVLDDWLLEMEERAQWLWIYGEAPDTGTGRMRFRVVGSAIERAYVTTIEYDRASGEAFRRIDGRWISNRPSGTLAPPSEVRDLARTAT